MENQQNAEDNSMKRAMATLRQENYNQKIVPEVDKSLDDIFGKLNSRLQKMATDKGKMETVKYIIQLMQEHGTPLNDTELKYAEGLILSRISQEIQKTEEATKKYIRARINHILSKGEWDEPVVELENPLEEAVRHSKYRAEDLQEYKEYAESQYDTIRAREVLARREEQERVYRQQVEIAGKIASDVNNQLDQWLTVESQFSGELVNGFRLHPTLKNFTEYCYNMAYNNGGNPLPEHAFTRAVEQIEEKMPANLDPQLKDLWLPLVREHFDEIMRREHLRRGAEYRKSVDNYATAWLGRLQDESASHEQLQRDEDIYYDLMSQNWRKESCIEKISAAIQNADNNRYFNISTEFEYVEKTLEEAAQSEFRRRVEACRTEQSHLVQQWLSHESEIEDVTYSRYTLLHMVYGSEIEGNSGYGSVERITMALQREGVERKYGMRVLAELKPELQQEIDAAIAGEKERRGAEAQREIQVLLEDWLSPESEKMDVSNRRYTLFSLVYQSEDGGGSTYSGLERVRGALQSEGLERKYGTVVMEEKEALMQRIITKKVAAERKRQVESATQHVNTKLQDWLRPESTYIGDTSLNRNTSQTWHYYMYMHYYEHYQGDVSEYGKRAMLQELARTAPEKYGKRIWDQIKPHIDAAVDDAVSKEVARRQQEMRSFSREKLTEWLSPSCTFTGDPGINKPSNQTFLQYLYLKTYDHYQGGKIEWAQRSASKQLVESAPRKYGTEVWSAIWPEVDQMVEQGIQKEYQRRLNSAKADMEAVLGRMFDGEILGTEDGTIVSPPHIASQDIKDGRMTEQMAITMAQRNLYETMAPRDYGKAIKRQMYTQIEEAAKKKYREISLEGSGKFMAK